MLRATEKPQSFPGASRIVGACSPGMAQKMLRDPVARTKCREIRIERFMDRSEPAMSHRVIFKFRLYTAADAQNSAQALANLNALCRSRLPGRHEIEVVDVFREPQRARADGIRMTPTLVKLAPPPTQKIVGTLSATQHVLQILGLADSAA
jgi:circadian clock protein KaiB